MLPDENYLDFGWSVIDDGGGILVTPAIQDLTVDLEERSRHVLSPLFLSSVHLHMNLPFCHLLLDSPPPHHLYYMVAHCKNPAQHQPSFKW